MKYREIYDVLEKQQIDVPGFRFSDYSGWRSPWQHHCWKNGSERRKLRHSKAHIVPEPHSSGR